MTRVTKLVQFIFRYITLECHQNEWLYVIQHHMYWRSSSLLLCFEVLIQVDGNVLCILLDEEECTKEQPRHMENINDMHAE